MKEKIIKNLEDLKQSSIKLRNALKEFKELNDEGKKYSEEEVFREVFSTNEIAIELASDTNKTVEEIENLYESLKG